MFKKLAAYKSSIILLLALVLGAFIGIYFPDFGIKLKPIGEIFLNLLFTIIVPLVCISVMSSIANMSDISKLGPILLSVLFVSFMMSVVPTFTMLGITSIIDPAYGVNVDLNQNFTTNTEQLDFVSMLTTNDFVGLLSKNNILALIIISVISGIAISKSNEKGAAVSNLLSSLDSVIANVVGIIMLGAPIGLGSYFAATMASQDPTILVSFGRVILMFFISALGYLFIGGTFYSWLAGGTKSVKIFWQNALKPMATALGTSSSLASLPVNIESGKKMKLDKELVEICLPLMANLNKGGVAMVTALKIAFIYSVLGLEFTPDVFAMAVIISIVSAVIVGGVPGGAFLGEIFIVTSLNLPLEAIPMLVIIGATTDSLVTVINVTHDLTAVQLIDRLINRKKKKRLVEEQSQ